MGRKKPEYIDDGRVIAPMNVDGMPWYIPKPQTPTAPQETPAEDTTPTATPTATPEPVQMTRRETLAFTWGVLRAALLAGLIFIGGLYLFILFCTEIWFK